MNLKKQTREECIIDIIKDVYEKEDKIIVGANSVAKGIGIARARSILNGNYNIVSIVDSNKIELGTFLDSLKDLVESKFNTTVVLNDIQTQNSKNNFFNKILKKFKNKSGEIAFLKDYFEKLGIKYVGPIEEKNTDKIEKALEHSKNGKKPTFIHVISKETKKQNYIQKEEKEDVLDTISDILENNSKVAIVNFIGNDSFKDLKQYEGRIFNGLNLEKNEFDAILGMAECGIIPVVFLDSKTIKKEYEILNKMTSKPYSVIFMILDEENDYSSCFDYSYLSAVANLTVIAPKNMEETIKTLEFAIKNGETCAIKMNSSEFNYEVCRKIKFGKAEILEEGENLTIVACGKMVEKAINISQMLKKDHISTEVINARFVNPIDREMINRSIEKTGFLVTMEENYLVGGVGKNINSMLESEVRILNIGYSKEALDVVQDNMEDILTEESIYNKIKNTFELNHNYTKDNMSIYENKENDVIEFSNKGEKVGNL